MLLGVAHERLHADDKAYDAFREARGHGISSLDPALEAEIEYYQGLASFGKDRLLDGRAACLRGLEAAGANADLSAGFGSVPLAHIVSRLQELLGVIDASEGRYGDFLSRARIALATLDQCPTPDIYQEGFALKNLSILARDFDIEDDARLMSTRVPALPWTEEISRVEFTTFEALGWCSALRGDSVAALRLFRRASTVASSDPERILVGVDRALLAREFGHRPMAIEEVENALQLAEAFDWERAAGDSRDALLTLAQAAAAISPSRARAALDRYTAIRNSMDSTFAARIEPRARAEEAYTHGLVLRAEGRDTASAERLEAAFETWKSIGYEWRAGRAALELAELNGADVFRLAVRRELFRRPNSVFSTRARLVA